MMRVTEEGRGGSRTRRNLAYRTPIYQSSDQPVDTHRISDRPISVHRADVHRRSAQRCGVQSANVHRDNVQAARSSAVGADHASRQPPVIHGSDVVPSIAQHTSGHDGSIDRADVKPTTCREPSVGQEVSYPLVREGRHDRLASASDVWLCEEEEEEEYGAHRHTHKTGYRAALLSSLLLLCILLLSNPYVPERFLGIRSPDQVLKSFNTPQNNNNKETEGIMQPNKSKQHSVQKRYVPHKFWARAQPNNKFLKKRRHYKHQPNHPHQVKDIYPLEDWPRVAVEAVNTLH